MWVSVKRKQPRAVGAYTVKLTDGLDTWLGFVWYNEKGWQLGSTREFKVTYWEQETLTIEVNHYYGTKRRKRNHRPAREIR